MEHDIAAAAPPDRAGFPIAASASDSARALTERAGFGVAPTVALLVVVVLAVYWRTTLSMVAIWERSETFAHGFVVIPIFFYLLWQRREALATIEPRPCFVALLGIAVAGAIWLLGELVSAASVSQFAMIAMVPFAVWAVLGTAIVMELWIPLAFLFFAVPVGEFLVPALMNWTADFTVAALRASGVPVYREGNFFLIPSGSWSIVEACSGLRYLIASFLVGCLYAYLSYRSPKRRAVFIAASLIVPIVANWMRAYMIVMLGHLSNNRLAVGVDHLIYGWFFFGLVMLALFWIGARWREDEEGGHSIRQAKEGPKATLRNAIPPRQTWMAAAAGLALVVIWQPLLAHFEVWDGLGTVGFPPISGRNGWIVVPEEPSGWRPDLSGARVESQQTFTKAGQRVGLHIAFYRGQTQDAKAVTSTNQLVSTTNRVWRQVASGTTSADIGGATLAVRTGVITRPGERLALWQWYWIDGRITSSDYAAKLYQALSVLEGHGDPAAWVIVFTRTEGDEAQVRRTLQTFATDMRAVIDAALQQAAGE